MCEIWSWTNRFMTNVNRKTNWNGVDTQLGCQLHNSTTQKNALLFIPMVPPNLWDWSEAVCLRLNYFGIFYASFVGQMSLPKWARLGCTAPLHSRSSWDYLLWAWGKNNSVKVHSRELRITISCPLITDELTKTHARQSRIKLVSLILVVDR